MDKLMRLLKDTMWKYEIKKINFFCKKIKSTDEKLYTKDNQVLPLFTDIFFMIMERVTGKHSRAVPALLGKF